MKYEFIRLRRINLQSPLRIAGQENVPGFTGPKMRTHIWTKEGWLYLSVILDVCGRRIVGWSVNQRLTKELVIEAFRRAVMRRTPAPGMIFRSDQGSQYASGEFRKLLEQHGVRAGMGSKGDCYDNAITESFFHTLKTELIYFENYQTREEARLSIFEYIEVFYNRKPRHSAIGYKTPVDFEKQNTYLNYLSEKTG